MLIFGKSRCALYRELLFAAVVCVVNVKVTVCVGDAQTHIFDGREEGEGPHGVAPARVGS